MGTTKKKLNPLQERFCQEYALSGNGSKSARTAGYSQKTAPQIADRLLKNINIQARIKVLQGKKITKLIVDFDYLTKKYKAIADANIQDYIGENNDIVDISKLTRFKASLVRMVKKTVTEFEGGTKTQVQIELHPIFPALDALSKHIGYFEADNSQKKPVIRVGFVE